MRGKGLRMKELRGINFSVFSTGHSSLITSHLPLISLFVTPKLLRHNIGRLPVVDRASPKKVVGYLGRAGILAARQRLSPGRNGATARSGDQADGKRNG